MKKILISACLLGDKVNYKGQGKYCPKVEELKQKYLLVPFCPEVEGGLSIPRLPSEIRGNRVIHNNEKDVTKEFRLGAEKALRLCKALNIKIAVLKENSPSCGSHHIHDGLFRDALINGEGFTTALLRRNGIEVYSEEEIDKLL